MHIRRLPDRHSEEERMHDTNFSALITQRASASAEYRPLILYPQRDTDMSTLAALLHDTHIMVFDTLASQLGELIKIRHPQERFSRRSLHAAVQAHVGDTDLATYGVWVYYPWSKRLVHTLAESEFVQVRTNRNHYKITPDEQRRLANKRIGVMGLSVGQAIALSLAMERSCGELRLADFDLLELTNLNRVRSGIHHLGISKVIAAAREIAEIDPFLNVTCFSEGVTEDNIDQFLAEHGHLDLLVEECDSLDIKILARRKARQFKIPVLMHTSDRGMFDVERFDRDPQRPILHGLIEQLDPARLKDLTSEEKIPYVLAMLGVDTLSRRIKASMLEVEQTIATWPQVATAVTLGGAIVGDAARRILLDQFHDSGRYFIDLDALVQDQTAADPTVDTPTLAEVMPALTQPEMVATVSRSAVHRVSEPVQLDQRRLNTLVEAATLAPSGGNAQPWQWLYQAGYLYLFHDPSRASFFDYGHTGAYLALGAATESLVLQAHALQLHVQLQTFVAPQQRLVGVFSFSVDDHGLVDTEAHICDPLVMYIPLRATNRNLSVRQTIRPALLQQLQQIGQTITGAQLTFLTSDAALTAFADIAAAVERLRLLNRQGHHDFVREIRWTREEAHITKDGIDLATIDLTPAEEAGLQVARSWPVVADVKQWGGGGAFEKLMQKTIGSASSVGLLTMPHGSLHDFFDGGRALQRVWLTATQAQLAFQPVASATFLFAHLLHGKGAGLDQPAIQELHLLRKRFVELFPIVEQQHGELLLFRLAVADSPGARSLRYPIEQVLFVDDAA
jgi:molybdopterin/thiamine biosynthesis adenylyltransferase